MTEKSLDLLRSIKEHQEKLDKLHSKWVPHTGQVEAGRAIFKDKKKVVMCQCGRNWGKALALDTKIPVPSGWKSMGDIEVGDAVFNENGDVETVTYVSEIMFNRSCYEIHFSDGSTIVADGDHRWCSYTKAVRKSISRAKNPMVPEVLTTKQIKNSLTINNRGEVNHMLKLHGGLLLPEKELPIHPYVLGAWLGDGNSRNGGFYTTDNELLQNISSYGYEITKRDGPVDYGILGLQKELNSTGLINNKHIPDKYLRASLYQRFLLLAGLMDTDGYVSDIGICEFVTVSKGLAHSVRELLSTLGIRATIKAKIPTIDGKECRLAYRIRFSPKTNVFKLQRKAIRLIPFLGGPRRKYVSIVDVVSVESVPVRCISVTGDNHLYLAGDSMLPTHNTEFAAYCAWRWALTRPGQQIYIIGPYRNQEYELLWANGRLQNFGPREYLKEGDQGVNKSELRLSFKNESFIKILGADNPDSLRGVKPNLVINDEFQNHSRESFEAMEPNLLAKGAPLLLIGTPPDSECFYTQVMDNLENRTRAGDKRVLFMQQPSRNNPYLDADELERKRREMFDIGEGAMWKREYEARFIPGGANAIFPRFDRDTHVVPMHVIEEKIKRDKKKLNWLTVLDPGTTTCFAGLFVALHPYTKEIFVMDEIYEKDRAHTVTDTMWARIRDKETRLFDYDVWDRVCDQAAAWFMNEVLDRFGENVVPCDKYYNDKDLGLSLMRSIMAVPGKLYVADTCKWLSWEISNYATDDKGRVPKKNDHLIDCFRYFLGYVGYELNESKEKKNEDEGRYTLMGEEMRQFRLEKDWTVYIDDPWYDEETDTWMM